MKCVLPGRFRTKALKLSEEEIVDKAHHLLSHWTGGEQGGWANRAYLFAECYLKLKCKCDKLTEENNLLKELTQK